MLAWVAQLAAKLEWKHIIEPREQRRLLPAPLSPKGFAEYQRTIKKQQAPMPTRGLVNLGRQIRDGEQSRVSNPAHSKRGQGRRGGKGPASKQRDPRSYEAGR